MDAVLKCVRCGEYKIDEWIIVVVWVLWIHRRGMYAMMDPEKIGESCGECNCGNEVFLLEMKFL